MICYNPRLWFIIKVGATKQDALKVNLRHGINQIKWNTPTKCGGVWKSKGKLLRRLASHISKLKGMTRKEFSLEKNEVWKVKICLGWMIFIYF
jgi:hypothetical protein